MRQRTLPEQRELLRGLGQTRAAAEPPRPGARPASRRRHGRPARLARVRGDEGEERTMSDDGERPRSGAGVHRRPSLRRRRPVASITWPRTAG